MKEGGGRGDVAGISLEIESENEVLKIQSEKLFGDFNKFMKSSGKHR